MLIELLNFFRYLSDKPEFHESAKSDFYTELLSLVSKYKYNDVIHAIIIDIFDNSKPKIEKSSKIQNLLAKFITSNIKKLKMP